MLTASVSNIDIFRVWKNDEDLDVGWLLARLASKEQTPQMKAGEALHKAIELAGTGEVYNLSALGYQFDFPGDMELVLPALRETRISKKYGDLLVRGRVDGVDGLVVTDYKSTGQFDPERLMSGYQWRFYLDMMEANLFRWKVFVLGETDDPKLYWIREMHTLEQGRYPELNRDCAELARQYAEFAKEHIEDPLTITAAEVA